MRNAPNLAANCPYRTDGSELSNAARGLHAFRNMVICLLAVALAACGRTTESDALPWYAGTWRAAGVPVVASTGVALDSLTLLVQAGGIAFQYTRYRVNGGSQAICGGYIKVTATASGLTTTRDTIREYAPTCGETWFQSTYTRSGANITTAWGDKTVTLTK